MLLNIAIILLLAVGVPFGWLAAVNNDLEAMDPERKYGDRQKKAAELFRYIGPIAYIIVGSMIFFAHIDLRPYGGMLFPSFLLFLITHFGRITKLPKWYVISSIVMSYVLALLAVIFGYLEMVAASAGANP